VDQAGGSRSAPYGAAEPDAAGDEEGTTGCDGAAVGAADGIGPMPGG
jgi:hypothetical protein